MGKGDRRSKKGKIWKGTFGVNRPRYRVAAYTGDVVEEVAEAPKKKAPAKKAPAKKAAAKKDTAESKKPAAEAKDSKEKDS